MKNMSDFDQLGKNAPFKVPDDFFENITLKTLDEAKRRPHKSFSHKIKITLSIAASILVLIVSGFFISRNINDSKKGSSEMSETFLDETIENIMASMTEEELKQMSGEVSTEIFLEEINNDMK